MRPGLADLVSGLFQPPGALTVGARRGRVAVLAGLYLLGLAHWATFLDYGRFPLDFHDWPKEAGYFAVLRQAVERTELPLHAAPSLVTERFLANPEVPLSPQVLMLPQLSDAGFVLLNTALMFSVGFVGLLLLGRRVGLSTAGFVALYLLFNFNGSVTAHLAVGHSMWVGYFLLPYFLWLVWMLLEAPARAGWPAGVALTLFGMLLVGAFHFVIWCMVFLILLALTRPSFRGPIGRALLLSLAVGASRILPAALEFGAQSRPFVGGFQSTWDLLEGLAAMKSPFEAVQTRVGLPNWWEVDFYIGLGGIALLLVWAVIRTAANHRSARPSPLPHLAPALILMTLLSLDPILRLASKLPVPLMGAERVSARLFVIPLLFLILIAVRELDDALRSNRRGAGRLAGLALLAFVTLDLWQHSRLWRVDLARDALDPRPPEPTPAIQHFPDPSYEFALLVGAVISLAAIAVCVWWVMRRPAICKGESI